MGRGKRLFGPKKSYLIAESWEWLLYKVFCIIRKSVITPARACVCGFVCACYQEAANIFASQNVIQRPDFMANADFKTSRRCHSYTPSAINFMCVCGYSGRTSCIPHIPREEQRHIVTQAGIMSIDTRFWVCHFFLGMAHIQCMDPWTSHFGPLRYLYVLKINLSHFSI